MTSLFVRSVAFVAAACVAASCGKMGDPRPPLRPVPTGIANLTAERTETRVTLAFTVPDINADRSTPPKIDGIEVYALSQAAAAPAPTVAQLAVPAYRVARIDVRPSGEPTKGASDTRPAPGGDASYADVLVAPVGATPIVRYYSVAGMVGSRRGAPSGVLALPLTPFRDAPADVSVDYNEQALTVTWSAASAADRFVVEEIDATGSNARRLTPAPVASGPFTAPYEIGKERCFSVRTVEAGNRVMTVGPASAPKCVTPVDRFAPSPPTGLNPFPGEGGVDLVWTPSASPDVAGYIVLRGDGPDGTLRPLMTEPVVATQYRDASVTSGATYSYQVIAVDKAVPPNRSEPSARVVVTARRTWRPGP